MKNSFFLLLAFCALVTLANAVIELPKHCPTNPFSSHLKESNVKLLEVPIISPGNSCGDEWHSYGVCCDESNLRDYVAKDKSEILEAVQNVTKVFKGFFHSIKRIKRNVLNITNKNTENEFEEKWKPVFNFVRGEDSLFFFKFMRKVMVPGGFHANMSSCWTKIVESRSTALCSVCSGRSDLFFTQKKILMVDSDCDSILSECTPAFDTMVKTLETLSKFLDLFRRSMADRFKYFRIRINYLRRLTNEIQTEQIQEMINKYLKLGSGQEKMNVAAGICSKFLTIQGPTLIEKIRTILQGFSISNFELKIQQFAEDLHNQNKGKHTPQPAAQNSNYLAQGKTPSKRLLFGANSASTKLGRRVLSFGDFGAVGVTSGDINNLPKLETIFAGDVSIVAKNADSSYSSYLGSTGTTVASHVGGRPFNMTDRFP